MASLQSLKVKHSLFYQVSSISWSLLWGIWPTEGNSQKMFVIAVHSLASLVAISFL